jgi:hypothetical protein
MKRLALNFILTCCAVATGVGLAVFVLPSPDGVKRPDVVVLYVEPIHLDIGEVWEDEQFHWALPVENRGISPVTVENTSCGCYNFTSEPRQFELQPGETRTVHLTLDLRDNSRGNRASRDVTVPVRFQCSTEQKEKSPQWETWHLRGQIKSAVKTKPVWHLGLHSELAESLPARTFMVYPVVPLAALEVDQSGLEPVS